MTIAKRLFIFATVVLSISFLSVARGTEARTEATKGTASTIEQLQGTWVGVSADDVSGIEVTVTVKGNTFRFHRDSDFWFETTIALREGTTPRQLLATIVRSAPSQGSSVGKVVPTIFKIGDGTLTIGAFGDVEDPPTDFEDIDAVNLYTLRLVSAKTIEGPFPEP